MNLAAIEQQLYKYYQQREQLLNKVRENERAIAAGKLAADENTLLAADVARLEAVITGINRAVTLSQQPPPQTPSLPPKVLEFPEEQREQSEENTNNFSPAA